MSERHADDALPGLLRTLAHTVRVAVRSSPRAAAAGLLLIPVGWIDGTLLALWLKLLVDAVTEADSRGILVAVALLVLTHVTGWVVGVFGQRANRTLQERAGAALENELIRVSAGTAGITYLERPDYVDRLDPLRKEAWLVHWTLESLAETLGAVAQAVLTIVLLATVDPVLALLPVFGIPSLLAARAAALRSRRAEESVAPRRRRQRHLVGLATTASPAKEIRVFGIEQQLLQRSREEWAAEHAVQARVTWLGAGWQIAASTAFAAGFVLVLLLVAHAVVRGQASAGDLALALVLAARMSQQLDMVVEMLRWLVGCLGTAQRFVWLVDEARREHRPDVPRPVPAQLRTGIELCEVSFRYPGTERLVLDRTSVLLPAGTVVAIVGENGAGKTTLVKLLTGMYQPCSGAVRIDGIDLPDLALPEWRRRCTGAFQDHARFELALREAVTIGDLDRLDDTRAAADALQTAGADRLTRNLPNGLDTQLGTTWPGGVELSSGQWQQVALARGLVRQSPLLTVLDEPTASLDPQTEDALFTRYAARARRNAETGGINLLISHRFSTVRAADLIFVLSNGRVAEQGSHDELMRRDGTYAELYRLQAQGYR